MYPQIQRSKYLGVNDVEGTNCDHLAFVQPELDIRTIARMSHGAPTMMSEAGAAVLGMVGGMALGGRFSYRKGLLPKNHQEQSNEPENRNERCDKHCQ